MVFELIFHPGSSTKFYGIWRIYKFKYYRKFFEFYGLMYSILIYNLPGLEVIFGSYEEICSETRFCEFFVFASVELCITFHVNVTKMCFSLRRIRRNSQNTLRNKKKKNVSLCLLK